MFVNADRSRLVDELLAEWRWVTEHRQSRLIVLTGEPGFGKTRIVHEFYARLASEQTSPYWPLEITPVKDQEIGSQLRSRRKAVQPFDFARADGVRPDFLWLGKVISDVDGDPGDSTVHELSRMISTHLARHFVQRERRRRALRAGQMMLSLVGFPVVLELALGAPSVAASIRAVFEGNSDDGIVSQHAGSEDELATFYRTVRQLWGRSGDNAPPTVVFLEDVHAAQQPTIDLIQQLLVAENLPFLVVTCMHEQSFTESEISKTLKTFGFSGKRLAIRELPLADCLTLAHAHIPEATPETVLALATKSDGNPYHLQLLILALKSQFEDRIEVVSLKDVASLPSQIDHLLQHLWDGLPAARRAVLSALALSGHRAPLELDRVLLDALERIRAFDREPSGWTREVGVDREFIEVARWVLARRNVAGSLDEGAQRILVEAGLAEICRRLDDPDNAAGHSLRTCLLALVPTAMKLGAEFDCVAVAEDLVELARSLRRDRQFEATIGLLDTVDKLMEPRSLRNQRNVVRLRLDSKLLRANVERIFRQVGSPAAVESAEEAIDFAQENRADFPYYEIRANLSLSRACRVPVGGNPDLRDRARKALEEAERLWSLSDRSDLDTLRNLMSASHPWAARTGDRRRAAILAGQTLALASWMHDELHPLTLEALGDLAFYTRRFDAVQGASIYSELVERRRRVWGDESHPSVAMALKSYAAALLALTTISDIESAIDAADRSFNSLRRSIGDDQTPTMFAAGIAASARMKHMRLSGVIREDFCHEALEMAQFNFDGQLRIRPNQPRYAARGHLGMAMALNGSAEGVDLLQAAFDDRCSQYPDPTKIAELRWMAESLHWALTLFDRRDEAENIRSQFQFR